MQASLLFHLFNRGNILRVGGIALVMLLEILLLSPQASYASSGNWPSYMRGNARDGFAGEETIINSQTVAQLKVHWQLHTATISSEPVVSNGVVYWGSWDGYEHATDLNGRQLWQTYVGQTTAPPGCHSAIVGVTGAATVVGMTVNGTWTKVVFVSGGDAHLYALNATNGQIIWGTALGTSSDYMLWAGPAVFNGSVYVGVSSYGDCPLIQGKVVQLDTKTGNIQHTFATVPDGCKGASVWMVPTIDEANQALYVATGNGGNSCPTEETHAVALVKLSTTDLSLIDSWQVPAAELGSDSDFGSTPTLYNARIGGVTHRMVGLVNKNGIYYAFDRAHIGAGPVWQKRVSIEGGNIASSSWDGKTLYTAGNKATVGGVTCGGVVRAHDPATGAIKWEYCAPNRIKGGLSAVPGVVFVGAGANQIALNATTGAPLFTFTDPVPGANFWAGASVSNGMLYTGNSAGNFYAFGL